MNGGALILEIIIVFLVPPGRTLNQKISKKAQRLMNYLQLKKGSFEQIISVLIFCFHCLCASVCLFFVDAVEIGYCMKVFA